SVARTSLIKPEIAPTPSPVFRRSLNNSGCSVLTGRKVIPDGIVWRPPDRGIVLVTCQQKII
ncbi:MAG TPA: hypothetical protein V6C72_08245, partial [Chroococcales cyanobacterium]